MDVLIDASCIIAILADESERNEVIEKTENTELYSASCLPFEIGNSLSAMVKRHRISCEQAVAAYEEFKKIPVRLIEPDISKALRIAAEENHYAYDAYYIACALDSKIPLYSLDSRMMEIAKKRGAKCL